jgi:hypothetical protein
MILFGFTILYLTIEWYLKPWITKRGFRIC